MNLEKFIENNEIEHTNNLISTDQLHIVEEELNVKFGENLTNYILKYGYLAYEDVEFYGITSNQYMQSDLIVQTRYLHNYFATTKELIAVESLGEGIYALVDKKDGVFIFDSVSGSIDNTGKNLDQYIYERLTNV